MTEFMHQCRLAREGHRTNAYIDESAAKLGCVVTLKGDDGGPWTVVHVGDRKEADWVRANENRFKEFQGSLKGGGIR